ncbi:hypothetical protein C7974DRAFT_406219 [Boeremia exigua]|uniref:uncharacterized protein n=1 Tax=Boeremia exigua TaxID=749465 RepID=UPI001E8EB017|nr:uncharacterized protein C7974DRAFT_406219 [Boeremia exigua]KAH6612719.1 hypothetical protein C7974DRAFT_406219 [Boeremia exigua]
MAPALPTADPAATAPITLVPAKLGNFRDADNQHVDASDSDQSDASGRSLSPTRQGLSKAKKKRERRQFGAFADELGDLLGAAFQSNDQPKSSALPASTNAVGPNTDGDLEMQAEPHLTGPKMSKRQRQNLARMQARKLAKEQSKMVTVEEQAVAAERKGMTIQEYRGQKPPKKKSEKNDSQRRRSRKERERLKKKAEQAGAMEID